MRPGRNAPENALGRERIPGAEIASMRPGRNAPENLQAYHFGLLVDMLQ